jgi:hypothetical protein
MSKIGIVKLLLKKRNVRLGNKNGTDSEVAIINPTTIGNLPPTKFTTKGDPSPVDMPDNKNTDNIKFVLMGTMVSENRFIIPYKPTGINTSFTIVSIINFFGCENTV